MRNGFTLIELLAVIAIIAVLAVVSYPKINDFLNTSNQKNYDTQASLVIGSAKEYISKYKEDVTEITWDKVNNQEETYVTIKKLKDINKLVVDEKYFKDEDLIKVTRNEGKYTYEIEGE